MGKLLEIVLGICRGLLGNTLNRVKFKGDIYFKDCLYHSCKVTLVLAVFNIKYINHPPFNPKKITIESSQEVFTVEIPRFGNNANNPSEAPAPADDAPKQMKQTYVRHNTKRATGRGKKILILLETQATMVTSCLSPRRPDKSDLLRIQCLHSDNRHTALTLLHQNNQSQ
jgi:hypothetical protein